MKQDLIVVGNGMVGQRFLEEAVQVGLHRRYRITVFGAESRPAYDRLHLSDYFSGRSAEDLSLVPFGFFESHDITFLANEKVTSLDVDKKLVSSDKRQLHYHKLILATGSFSFVPPIAGRERPNCFIYRSIDDLEAIASAAGSSEVGVVIGGGLLGLEAARALLDMGLQSHVVEFAPWLMSQQIDEKGGTMLRKKIEQTGVFVHTGVSTESISQGEFYAHRLRFSDGSYLEADLVIFSAGIRPQDELARNSGLSVGERGGIVVDDFLHTSAEDIYAIGECACWRGSIFGLVAPGYQMARLLAHNLATDEPQAFSGADLSTSLKVLGVELASIGDAQARTPGAACIHYLDEQRQVYKKLVTSADGRSLLGAILLGDLREYGALLALMRQGTALPERPHDLIFPRQTSRADIAQRQASP